VSDFFSFVAESHDRPLFFFPFFLSYGQQLFAFARFPYASSPFFLFFPAIVIGVIFFFFFFCAELFYIWFFAEERNRSDPFFSSPPGISLFFSFFPPADAKLRLIAPSFSLSFFFVEPQRLLFFRPAGSSTARSFDGSGRPFLPSLPSDDRAAAPFSRSQPRRRANVFSPQGTRLSSPFACLTPSSAMTVPFFFSAVDQLFLFFRGDRTHPGARSGRRTSLLFFFSFLFVREIVPAFPPLFPLSSDDSSQYSPFFFGTRPHLSPSFLFALKFT